MKKRMTWMLLFVVSFHLPLSAQKMVPVGHPRGFGGMISRNMMEVIDSVVLRVQYHTFYRDSKEDVNRQECVEALYIGQKMSEYRENVFQYSDLVIPQELHEAAKRSKDTLNMVSAMLITEQRKYKITPYTIRKNYPAQGQQTDYENLCLGWMIQKPKMNFKLFFQEPIAQIEWELVDGDSTIVGYVCQKATTTFRGRRWTVWYSPDLPYQDGPWKLCGLPGLILKADDAAGDFSFEAVGLTKPKDEYIGKHPDLDGYTKITTQRLQELMVLKYKNPDAFYSMVLGAEQLRSIMESGYVEKFATNRTACLIERFDE